MYILFRRMNLPRAFTKEHSLQATRRRRFCLEQHIRISFFFFSVCLCTKCFKKKMCEILWRSVWCAIFRDCACRLFYYRFNVVAFENNVVARCTLGSTAVFKNDAPKYAAFKVPRAIMYLRLFLFLFFRPAPCVCNAFFHVSRASQDFEAL